MSGPFARIIAQVVVTGASIFSRAFVAAYSQALHSELSLGHSLPTHALLAQKHQDARALCHFSLISPDLTLHASLQMRKRGPKRQYDKYFEANNPSKGGSFYLQSKV
ncbi:unnamed protein product, partial [Chrysoparadoxa australica]